MLLRVLLSLILITTLVSCSSVRPWQSSRRGLFDVLDGAGSAPVFSHRASRISAERQIPFVRKKIAQSNWGWPLKYVHLTSSFGKRGRRFHEGIDLRARIGTPTLATAKGKVVYAGSGISGYGRMVVISHPDELFTIYSHLSRFLVKKGQKVYRGDQIGLSGKSGRVTAPHLHFEIRRGTTPVDPLRVYPSRLLALLKGPRVANRK